MHKQKNRFDVTLTLLMCSNHSDIMSNLILKRGEICRRIYVPWKESCSHCIALLSQRQINESPALRVGFPMSTGASQRWTVLFLDQQKWIDLQPHNLFQRTQKFIVTVCPLCIMMQLAVSEKTNLLIHGSSLISPIGGHSALGGLCLTFGAGVFYWCDLFPEASVSATPGLS